MTTKTIKSNGSGDYTTISAWASYANALALSAPEVGDIYNLGSEYTESATVVFGGWTGNSSSNTITLKCATGNSFSDNASVQSNALRYNPSNGVAVKITQHYDDAIHVTGVNFFMTGLQVCADSFVARRCIFDDASVSSGIGGTYTNCILNVTGSVIGNTVITGYNINLFNVLFYNGSNGTSGGGAIFANSHTAQSVATDVTIVATRSSTGAGAEDHYTPGVIFKNCAVAGFATDFTAPSGAIGSADASSTNNATDKSSFGGTNWGANGQVSIVPATEWQSVTFGSEDFRLNSTSAKLKNNGATVGPTTDIAGTSRPQGAAYDIGCWELVVAATDVIPLYQRFGFGGPQSYGLRI